MAYRGLGGGIAADGPLRPHWHRLSEYQEHLQHGQPLPLPLQVPDQDPHLGGHRVRARLRRHHDVAPDRLRARDEDHRQQEPPGLDELARRERHEAHRQAPGRRPRRPGAERDREAPGYGEPLLEAAGEPLPGRGHRGQPRAEGDRGHLLGGLTRDPTEAPRNAGGPLGLSDV